MNSINLLGFDVLYVSTCFTTTFSVANNQPRISHCLFNQLRLCPALWYVNRAALNFGRNTLSVFHFLQVHPSGPPELGERRSPSKNGRGIPFPRFPPQFDHCVSLLSCSENSIHCQLNCMIYNLKLATITSKQINMYSVCC